MTRFQKPFEYHWETEDGYHFTLVTRETQTMTKEDWEEVSPVVVGTRELRRKQPSKGCNDLQEESYKLMLAAVDLYIKVTKGIEGESTDD